MLKYPQKNNNKDHLLYHELAGTFIYCIVLDTKKSTLKYGINDINSVTAIVKPYATLVRTE